MARIAVYFLVAIFGLAGCAGSAEDETVGWSAQRLYGEAKDAMSSKDWPRAVKYLEKLEARYPYGRFAQQAQLEIAYCHWKADDRAAALAATDRFIKLYPNHANVDYAYYLKGLINFNDDLGMFSWLSQQDLSERDQKAAKDSFETFRELVTRFPESRYAQDARQRMTYIVNSLAQYEVHVARYYYQRGAYVAAVARAQRAIADYDTVPATEEALYILVKSYDALGLVQLRDDARRVLDTNYPGSTFITQGFKGEAKAWWQLW